jgi:hypothetical protein
VIARIKDLVQARSWPGSRPEDLTDRQRGLHLVIEIRNGFHPDAVLEELYRLTPMEETFGINNVALVDGSRRCSACAICCRSTSTTASRSCAGARVPAPQARRPAAPGRRPGDRAAQHRRGHRGHQDQ